MALTWYKYHWDEIIESGYVECPRDDVSAIGAALEKLVKTKGVPPDHAIVCVGRGVFMSYPQNCSILEDWRDRRQLPTPCLQ